MGKGKLAKFEENAQFPNLFQPVYGLDMEAFYLQGKWNKDFFKREAPIVLELGCGKGEYTVGLASQFPEKNFIGVDIKGARLWTGLKKAKEENLCNVAFIRTRIDFIHQYFGNQEVDEIWITFPDPQHSKERKRLTSPTFLEKYARFLKKDGIIHLKTDDTFLHEYTLQDAIKPNDHRLLYETYDLYAPEAMDFPGKQIKTFYEQMWLIEGKKIKYIRFQLKSPQK